MADSFYLYLPSNASPKIHPDNTASQYQVTLNDPVWLVGEDWEVGLDEITYIHSFANIQSAEFEYIRRTPADVGVFQFQSPQPSNSSEDVQMDNDHFSLEFDSRKGNILFMAKPSPGLKKYYYCTKQLAYYLGFAFREGEDFAIPNSKELHYIGENHSKEKRIYKNLHPHSRVLPKQGHFYIYVLTKMKNPLGHNEAKISLPTGFYPTPKDLLKRLNGASNVLSFAYDEYIHRFTCHFHAGDSVNDYRLIFKGGLNRILGFSKSEYNYSDQPLIAEHAPYMFAGSNVFYIYCSICTDVDVGNKKLPLLRTIPINTATAFGDVVNIPFKLPVYIPLNTTYIDRITIDIRNDNNVPIQFTEGKTQLVLHFRKKL